MQLVEISIEGISYAWRLGFYALGNILGLAQAVPSLLRGLLPPSLFPLVDTLSVPLAHSVQGLAPMFTMLGNIMPPIDIDL